MSDIVARWLWTRLREYLEHYEGLHDAIKAIDAICPPDKPPH